jgi:hypothetical protein
MVFRSPPDGHHKVNPDPEQDNSAIVCYTRDAKGRLAEAKPTIAAGRAIGHYSRYARPGSVRLEVVSSDTRLRLQAFRDEARSRLVMVIVNNATETVRVDVELSGGLKGNGKVAGDQTVERGRSYWTPITAFSLGEANSLSVAVPGRSVTSLAVPLELK